MPQIITNERKLEIISKIRNEGLSVRLASEQYTVSTKTIYHWLRDGVTDGNRSLVLDNARLKKENQQLQLLIQSKGK